MSLKRLENSFFVIFKVFHKVCELFVILFPSEGCFFKVIFCTDDKLSRFPYHYDLKYYERIVQTDLLLKMFGAFTIHFT